MILENDKWLTPRVKGRARPPGAPRISPVNNIRRARTAESDETPHAVCRWQSRPTNNDPTAEIRFI